MPGISTTQVTEIQLAPRLKQQLLDKLTQFDRNDEEIKRREAQNVKIKQEVDDIMTQAGEGNALLAGVDIDGYRVKLVTGLSTRLDKDRLKRQHGLTQADLDACSDTKPNTPYIKVTLPKEKAA